MKILGVSCYYHNAAAVLLNQGKLIAAAEEERFSRKKHDSDFPANAIQFCLDQTKINASQLDYAIFYEKPFLKFERLLKQILFTYPQSRALFISTVKEWLPKKLWLKQQLAEKLPLDEGKILFCDHHLSHAASCFYPSPFKKAAILTLDGVGEWSTATYGIGQNNKIKIIKEQKFPHSLGLLYSVFTAFLGFEVNDGEYKVMGMAPYGTPKYTEKIKKLVKVNSDGSIKLNLDYFSFHHSPYHSYNQKFTKLFGSPRPKEELFFTSQTGFPSLWGEKPKNYQEKLKANQHYADVAASIQKVTEEIILKICQFLAQETKLNNLCLAGGVGLNSVVNGKIISQTPFKNLFVQPAAGDAGGALGAALYLQHLLEPSQPREIMTHTFYGQAYSPKTIKEFLIQDQIPYHEYKEDKNLIRDIARALTQQKVVAWFEGRFEWGPRALGHRSILADPRSARMKDIVNAKIKFREPYRPFAPAVLEEKTQNFFDLADPSSGPAKFMILVIPTKKNQIKKIPAVSHLGTSRIQTVNPIDHPRYYSLIKEFGQLTQVPVLMNTSFNLKGEPIVNSPQNAYNTFINSGLDLLVMENFVINKQELKQNETDK